MNGFEDGLLIVVVILLFGITFQLAAIEDALRGKKEDEPKQG